MSRDGRPSPGMALTAGVLSIVIFPAGLMIGPFALIFAAQAAESGASRMATTWAMVLGCAGMAAGAAYLTTFTLQI